MSVFASQSSLKHVHLSVDKLLPWVYPKVDCRLAFVDSDTPGRGCAYSSLDKHDGHHPCFCCRGRRPHVYRRPDHLDNTHRWPHDHDFGIKLDPIWDSKGGNPDHIDFDHLCSDNIDGHTDKSSSASLLQGETSRQLRPT